MPLFLTVEGPGKAPICTTAPWLEKIPATLPVMVALLSCIAPFNEVLIAAKPTLFVICTVSKSALPPLCSIPAP